jgi:signal transduction histidine kinase
MDPDDFGEIVGNILDNARKHARSRVRVFGSAQEGGPRICFDDDGPGIPAEDRERLVMRGERAISGGEGSGLGLSIVVEALERYGLQLSIEESSFGGCRLSFPAIGFSAIPVSQGSPERKAPLKRSAVRSLLAGRGGGAAGPRL